MKRESPGAVPTADQPPRKKTLAIAPNGKPRFQGCNGIRAYDMLGKLGEGTFGYVRSDNAQRAVSPDKVLAERFTRLSGNPTASFLP